MSNIGYPYDINKQYIFPRNINYINLKPDITTDIKSEIFRHIDILSGRYHFDVKKFNYYKY